MIVLIVEGDDLDFGMVDPKRHPPVLGDEQASCSLAIVGLRMNLPAGHGAKLTFTPHVLKESGHVKRIHRKSSGTLQAH